MKKAADYGLQVYLYRSLTDRNPCSLPMTTCSPEAHMSVTCSFRGALHRCFPFTEYRCRAFLSWTHTQHKEARFTRTQNCVWRRGTELCLIPSVWLCPLYRCAPLDVPPRTQPGAWWTWAESSHMAAAESACTDPSEQCEWSPSHPVTHTNCYSHFCITFYSQKSAQKSYSTIFDLFKDLLCKLAILWFVNLFVFEIRHNASVKLLNTEQVWVAVSVFEWFWERWVSPVIQRLPCPALYW